MREQLKFVSTKSGGVLVLTITTGMYKIDKWSVDSWVIRDLVCAVLSDSYIIEQTMCVLCILDQDPLCTQLLSEKIKDQPSWFTSDVMELKIVCQTVDYNLQLNGHASLILVMWG